MDGNGDGNGAVTSEEWRQWRRDQKTGVLGCHFGGIMAQSFFLGRSLMESNSGSGSDYADYGH